MAESNNTSRRRKRRKAAQGGAAWKAGLHTVARIPLAIGGVLVSRAAEKKGTTAAVALGLLALWGVGRGIDAVGERVEKALPAQIVVDAPTQALREGVRRIAKEHVTRAEREKKSRSALLGELSAKLLTLDAVDDFQIRSGMDRRLQIQVTSQIPLFVLEGQGKERVLIGHKMRLLQRKVGAAEFPHLLRIAAPDFKVSLAFPEKTEPPATERHGRRLGGARAKEHPPMNFAWLANQGSRIREAFARQKSTHLLEEIAWRNSTGFSLRLKGTDPLTSERVVEVLLGEQDLEKKISKLPEIFSDLSAKALHPENIDLNYSDKALIRLSESATNIAL